MSEGPLAAYRALRRSGEIKPDSAQELAAEKLQSLANALAGWRPAAGPAGWKLRLGLARENRDPPQGLYLYGPVGRGKSMLLDLFFRAAEVERKRRVHFHAFMLEVHERLRSWRARTHGTRQDPLPELAGEIGEEAMLLCFDELVVTNIADAMILGRLFESLFARGVVVVATSNFEPDRLYEDGLQRERLLPFIALLKQRLDLLDLGSGTDYRLESLKQEGLYHQPLGPAAERALGEAFARLTEGVRPAPASLMVRGRSLQVTVAARGVARFSFEELCARPLGAEDYLSLAVHFHAIVLAGVPKLAPRQHNEARRFMTLIDALYEHRTKLVVSAAGEPEELYPEGTGAFEFRRTASRLNEMRSQAYLELPHLT